MEYFKSNSINDKTFLKMAFPKKYTYTLCPSTIYIDNSFIHGHGIFANCKICNKQTLCLTHITYNNQLLRVDIGGLINHSDKPNCKIDSLITQQGLEYYLISTKDIYKREELTVDYNLSYCGFH